MTRNHPTITTTAERREIASTPCQPAADTIIAVPGPPVSRTLTGTFFTMIWVISLRDRRSGPHRTSGFDDVGRHDGLLHMEERAFELIPDEGGVVDCVGVDFLSSLERRPRFQLNASRGSV